mmetsp:Transcript_1309/g.1349  ORF Transcript_1309/g.1349 Transcript_1309/m.1349 type:complete len:183 (+) Transcript_1309:223-771(+)
MNFGKHGWCWFPINGLSLQAQTNCNNNCFDKNEEDVIHETFHDTNFYRGISRDFNDESSSTIDVCDTSSSYNSNDDTDGKRGGYVFGGGKFVNPGFVLSAFRRRREKRFLRKSFKGVALASSDKKDAEYNDVCSGLGFVNGGGLGEERCTALRWLAILMRQMERVQELAYFYALSLSEIRVL